MAVKTLPASQALAWKAESLAVRFWWPFSFSCLATSFALCFLHVSQGQLVAAQGIAGILPTLSALGPDKAGTMQTVHPLALCDMHDFLSASPGHW